MEEPKSIEKSLELISDKLESIAIELGNLGHLAQIEELLEKIGKNASKREVMN